jgi:hypothetical protein
MKKFTENIKLLRESIKGPDDLCDIYEKEKEEFEEKWNDKFLKMIYLILNNYMEYDDDPDYTEGDYSIDVTEDGSSDPINLSGNISIYRIIHQGDGVWVIDGDHFGNDGREYEYNSGIGNLRTSLQSELLRGIMDITGILDNYGTKAIVKINK